MKILFLDIDGVLNSHRYLSGSDLEDRGLYSNIDPRAVRLLKGIVDCTGARLVLSSSWRSLLDGALQPTEAAAAHLLAALRECGLTLYDKTGDREERRGAEIREWLSHHPAVEAFAILDDDLFADWGELAAHWVKTSYYIGLTRREADQAVALLGKTR